MTERGIGALCSKPNEAIGNAYAVRVWRKHADRNGPIGHGRRQFIVRIDTLM